MKDKKKVTHIKYAGRYSNGLTLNRLYDVLEEYSSGDFLIIDDLGRKRVVYKNEAEIV